MSIGTKNIPTSGSKISKTLEPGNAECKINSITLKPFTFKEGGYEIILNMEGKDMGSNFEGFFVDNKDHSQGRYTGQVGKVKSAEWAYANATTKGGIAISRDTEMLKFLKSLCEALGTKAVAWFEAEDNKHDTIESLMEKFEQDKPYKDIFLNFCFAGKEYLNKEGYTNHELFLPKFTKTSSPFEALNANPSRLAAFNPADHIRKKKSEVVSNFSDGERPGTNAPDNGAGSDFSLD